ncbi:cryptochrome/photolyase family protein [Desertihabitans aurantiacus]|uniref:cryptochrome/photolyase family protein n=1 Tax=Desertihabitans aurantiacus TaxID=2282477 RepID=UPI000DF848C5|nr:deoxyribodipyrimidine photo-lyase [Desertihabitans aurantiacus]
MSTSLMWFRRDLRLSDHPALAVAAGSGAVLPVFVLDPRLLATAGPVRTSCLLQALDALRRATDGALVVRTGDPATVLPDLVAEIGAEAVHVTGETTPFGRRRDRTVEAALDVPLVTTGSPYAVTPGRLRNAGGDPFQVYSPFARAWREHGWPPPAATPRVRWSRRVDSEELPPSPLAGVEDAPELPVCSEQAAQERLRAFLDDGLADYAEHRDRPDLNRTSELSMHLKYGTVHPRTVLDGLTGIDARSRAAKGAEKFAGELAWRDFYADVLWHHPRSAWQDLRPALRGMRYDEPDATFDAWRAGRTGFPLVDAGMRQLTAVGWMHNRVRMVTASFLTKDLHIWWPYGARHFMDHLRDGDLSSNNHNWQWVAGTGTDPSPYFRIFNPVTQARRFDPQGDYVRRWVPELRHLEGAAVHEPWTASDGAAHGYPERVVDHAAERAEALARYEAVRG